VRNSSNFCISLPSVRRGRLGQGAQLLAPRTPITRPVLVHQPWLCATPGSRSFRALLGATTALAKARPCQEYCRLRKTY
jgi:hypothetical protein